MEIIGYHTPCIFENFITYVPKLGDRPHYSSIMKSSQSLLYPPYTILRIPYTVYLINIDILMNWNFKTCDIIYRLNSE